MILGSYEAWALCLLSAQRREILLLLVTEATGAK